MNKSKKMKDLLAKLTDKIKEAEDLQNKDDVTVDELKNAANEIETIKAKIKIQEAADEGKVFDDEGNEIFDMVPENEPLYAQASSEEKPLHLYDNFYQQLKDVRNAAVNNVVSDKLRRINTQNAAAGANESNPDEGGYAVQSDFAGMMMDSAAKAGEILSRVDMYEVSKAANRLTWTEVDETSIAASVFGGIVLYWAAEANTVDVSKIKLIEKEIKLQKLMGLAYATYEMEGDTNFISELYTRAFKLGIQRELENASIAGNGVGKPLGFLKGSGLITVNKESGQPAATVNWKNIVSMYHRSPSPQKSTNVWLAHNDVSEQFDFLEFPVGTGGVPVYLQESLKGDTPRLKNKPVITSDLCSALGTAGDLNYVDLQEYLMIYKGGVRADTSMHVQFLTDQNCYRFIFRANGMPKKAKALTIANSTKKRSPYVALQTRS